MYLEIWAPLQEETADRICGNLWNYDKAWLLQRRRKCGNMRAKGDTHKYTHKTALVKRAGFMPGLAIHKWRSRRGYRAGARAKAGTVLRLEE